MRRPLWRAFARLVGADLSEVRDPLDSFESLQSFFTRALADGARPLDPDPAALLAPCDGRWGESGRIEDATLLQLKGRPYSLGALLGDDSAAKRFEDGTFATFYLAPGSYHRFHTPCAAQVTRASYLPGSLWPVNRIGVEGVSGLFAENERIVAWLEPDSTPGAQIVIAAVGATLVGKVHVVFDALTTHVAGAQAVVRDYDSPPALARGQEWGRFEFGSTLVMVASRDALTLDPEPPGSELRLGTRIGRLGSQV